VGTLWPFQFPLEHQSTQRDAALLESMGGTGTYIPDASTLRRTPTTGFFICLVLSIVIKLTFDVPENNGEEERDGSDGGVWGAHRDVKT